MHSQQGIWSPEAFAAYTAYMDSVAFHEGDGPGTDAKIATSDNQKKELPTWKSDWEDHLTGEVDPHYVEAYPDPNTPRHSLLTLPNKAREFP